MVQNIEGAYSPQKLLQHNDRVNEFLGGENVCPVTIEMNITNRCNFNCPWCSETDFRGRHPDAEMPPEVVISTVWDMVNSGVRSITWEGGGEPTLHHDFNTIVANIPNNIDHGLITNGSLLHIIPVELLNKFKYIRISFDAPDRDVFKRIHGRDMFDNVVSNARYVAKHFKGVFGLSYIVSKDTVDGMFKAAALARDIGVDYIQFKPMLASDNTIAYVDMGSRLEDIMEYENKPEFNIFLSRFSDDEVGTPYGRREYSYCRAHRFVGAVTATGSVELCCNLKHKYPDRFSFGNLNDESYSSIWNGLRRQKILKEVEGDPLFLPTICGYCRMNEFNMILEDRVDNNLYSPLWKFI